MPLAFVMEQCDGIIISGGEDIPPELYAGDALETPQEPLERVMWEQLLIDACEAAGKPLLGVCYGLQLVALHYGGSLVQDIGREVKNHTSTAEYSMRYTWMKILLRPYAIAGVPGCVVASSGR